MKGKIILGMMRIAKLGVKETDRLVRRALDLGIDFLDNADIYGGGDSERLLGEVLGQDRGLRDKLFIQSKCGIRRGCFDFSKEHILTSVDGILQRLKTDFLDALLLHRPDALVDFGELNETFALLYKSGKVKSFGVSNMNSYQLQLFEKYVKLPVKYNQMQLSVVHSHMISQGLFVNMSAVVLPRRSVRAGERGRRLLQIAGRKGRHDVRRVSRKRLREKTRLRRHREIRRLMEGLKWTIEELYCSIRTFRWNGSLFLRSAASTK